MTTSELVSQVAEALEAMDLELLDEAQDKFSRISLSPSERSNLQYLFDVVDSTINSHS